MKEVIGKKHVGGQEVPVPLIIESIITPNHEFPNLVPQGQLELALNSAFSSRDMRVVQEFLVPGTLQYPQGLSYVTYVMEAGNSSLAGGSITENDAILNGRVMVPYRYISKVFVPEPYQGNGLMSHIMDETLEFNPGGQLPALAVLRTSSEKLHEGKYEPRSDIWVRVGSYYVHGFNFLNKITDTDRPERFPGAFNLFDRIARHVTLKVPTAVPISGAGFRYLE
ncbi:hypothetical protein HYX06_01975 [Candidatus Woesearchaeota archaeon]|nr:hypothetical protein [Candidatus Woesearchaeota archaeon]